MRPNLKQTVHHRQRVVKHGRVREIAHAEIIEPLERAGMDLPIDSIFNAYLAGKHSSI